MIKTLIEELEKIAEKNHDKFNYKLVIRPDANDKKIGFLFVAEGEKGSHFLTGFGDSPEEATEAAYRELDGACMIWDFKR